MAPLDADVSMTGMRDIAARALADIPGWAAATLTPLQGGSTNATWLVEKGGRRATLKADASVRDFPFAGRDTEGGIQQAAAASGLANDVIYASPTVLLTEYADGSTWTGEALGRRDNLASLARLLRRVHQLPPTGRTFDALRAAELYASRIAAKKSANLERVDERLAVLHALPVPAELRCCHNDVVADNILATPALRLIDWEYAADNDPMFDLAVVVVHHDLDESQAACLLDAYAKDAAPHYRERLASEMRRYRALAWLWQAARP